MVWTRAQKTSGTVATGTAISLPSSTLTGSIIVVNIESATSSGSPTFTMASNMTGGTWTSLASANVLVTAQVRLQQFYFYNYTGRAAATVTPSGTGTGLETLKLTIEEYTPTSAITLDPGDQSANCTPGFNVATSNATGTLSQAAELVVGGIADATDPGGGVPVWALGTGYTFNTQVTDAATEDMASEYKVVAATTAVTVVFAGTQSGNTQGVIVGTYKDNAGGATIVDDDEGAFYPYPFLGAW